MAWHQTAPATRGYGPAWVKLRNRVLKRDKHVCQCERCRRLGRKRLATEVDHIIPKAKGGSDAMTNLQAINADCHRLKTISDAGGAVPVRIGLDGFPIE